MQTLKELYKLGCGPSSSHTMGPQKACRIVKAKYESADAFKVYLYGSLSLTGKGHLTDYIIEQTLGEGTSVSFCDEAKPEHPNTMKIEAYAGEKLLGSETIYSVGGGEVQFKGTILAEAEEIYPESKLIDIRAEMRRENLTFYDYAVKYEKEDITDFLKEMLTAMFECVERGIEKDGVLPGRLQLKRVAKSMYQNALVMPSGIARERLLISSYAYAVAEENASGNQIVTAPTCGASGVMPAVLYYCRKQLGYSEQKLTEALATGGLFGNSVKTNATISGAAGGCQAEIGTACAMTAAAYAYLMNLSDDQIEYAAEMAIEHNLGLTCDPVYGYVQIPCIERNGFAALRAIDSAIYASQLGTMRKNKVSFDAVVRVMYHTGKDLNAAYRETSRGGLAKEFSPEVRQK